MNRKIIIMLMTISTFTSSCKNTNLTSVYQDCHVTCTKSHNESVYRYGAKMGGGFGYGWHYDNICDEGLIKTIRYKLDSNFNRVVIDIKTISTTDIKELN